MIFEAPCPLLDFPITFVPTVSEAALHSRKSHFSWVHGAGQVSPDTSALSKPPIFRRYSRTKCFSVHRFEVYLSVRTKRWKRNCFTEFGSSFGNFQKSEKEGRSPKRSNYLPAIWKSESP